MPAFQNMLSESYLAQRQTGNKQRQILHPSNLLLSLTYTLCVINNPTFPRLLERLSSLLVLRLGGQSCPFIVRCPTRARRRRLVEMTSRFGVVGVMSE